jgi:hypothetical protein
VTGDGWGDGPPADVVEQGGGRHFPSPNWRPPRFAAVLLAVGLVIGLVAGYVIGHRQVPGNSSLPQPTSSSASPVPVAAPLLVTGSPMPLPGGPQLTQTADMCSALVGRELQLGVQVTNQGSASVSLGQVQTVLPLGGLRVVSQRWARCGALAGLRSVVIAPGASAWFSVTFDLLERCPGAFPVQFKVAYDWGGFHNIVVLPGFADLSQVPYPGCPAG